MDRVKAALSEPAQLVSMMLVNNETGAWFDVAQVFAMAKARCPQTVTHCDAVQGFLKVPFTPLALHADLVSVSSHKIHGPMGMGALYVSSDVIKTRSLIPYLNGGGQEKGFRSGTENVMGICGFGAAVAAERERMSRGVAHMNDVRQYAVERMKELGLQVNLPEGKIAPHIVNVTLPQIKSETMLHFLWGKGICVSSGSACSSHAKHPSSALLAFGLSAAEADCSLRISLCTENTKEQIDALTDGLREGLDTLVRIRA
jgi:cysteine desulfurase